MAYALITNNIVQNIIIADNDFITTISPQYDVVVNLDGILPSPQISWVYNAGVFSDPTSLPAAKLQKISQLQTDVQYYIDAHYSLLNRTQLMNLYTLAMFDGLTNRATYLRPGINWINSIITYSVSIATTIQGLSTVSDVTNFTYDIQSNILADPHLTVGAAIQIAD